MNDHRIVKSVSSFILAILLLFAGQYAFAIDKIPAKPSPPRLVNDFAHMMTAGQQEQLEQKLLDFSNTTSNEITIVTIDELGDYDVSDFAIKLGKEWGVGRSGKNNGVVIVASLKDHKINISSGKGLEGALTDLMCGRIIRNEMVPSFRDHNYYEGFSKAADAVIAVTKGEYKADQPNERARGDQHIPFKAIVILIIFVIIILRVLRGGGGNNNGGIGNLATGFLIGNMLGGGRGGGWGGDSGGSGGFGGFGGGDFGGGGASGSW